MHILCSGFKDETDGGKPAQSVGDSRFSAGDPDRVGYGNRVRGESLGSPLHKVFEIRASNFFFEFPDELNIHGCSMLDRVACAEQRRQGRSLVIRGAATDVTISFLVKDERLPLPLRFIGRLHIEMVV